MPTEGAKRSSYCSENPSKKKARKMYGANEEEKKPMLQSPHINLKFETQVEVPLKPMDKSTHINLKFHLQDGKDLFFRMNRSAQLGKARTTYCDHMSIDPKSRVFLFNGRGFKEEQTPDELEMEDGDEIDVMLLSNGGGFGGV